MTYKSCFQCQNRGFCVAYVRRFGVWHDSLDQTIVSLFKNEREITEAIAKTCKLYQEVTHPLKEKPNNDR